MKPVNLNIEIGELVLHGFEGVDGTQVGASLRAELTRMLSRQGWPGDVDAVMRADLAGGSFDIRAGSDAYAIGRDLARHIYQGMGRTGTGQSEASAMGPSQGSTLAATNLMKTDKGQAS